VSVFRDITQMVEVDRLKSEFVSTVSHELRTPMTSIKGYADLLLLGAAGDISEAQQRFLETIKQNADRLSILVNDLLEVSRIDQDRVPLRFSPVKVEDLLEGIVAHLHSKMEESGRPMVVEVESNGDLPALRADYDRIVQVLQNLADNAFNYTPNGGQIRLTAVYDKAEKEVELAISDTGHGIPESIQGRIFERFFRGDEYDEMVMESPGTGLGLSIVKSLVEMHDGSIRFESAIGQGTTFYIRIPVMDEQSIASEQNQ
jgi:signal transduction histidine kinase